MTDPSDDDQNKAAPDTAPPAAAPPVSRPRDDAGAVESGAAPQDGAAPAHQPPDEAAPVSEPQQADEADTLAGAAAAADTAAKPDSAQPAAPASGGLVPAGGGPAGPDASVLRHLSVPNILTAARCLSVIVIVVLLIWPWGPLMTGALVVFGLSALTDWLDGRIARAFNLVSDLGRMLDHIADKLLVGITMLALCAIGVIDGLNVLAAALILTREIAISGLREHLAPRGIVVPASNLGKWKTTFQMVALAALMASPLAPFELVARIAALLILWVAMGMTLVSGFQYVWGTRKAWSE